MGNSFKLNHHIRKKKKTDYSLILMFVFIFIAITCMVISIWMMTKKNEVIYVEKKNNHKQYIYTYKKVKLANDQGMVEIPIINLVGKNINQLNDEIQDDFQQISKNKNYTYQYQFSQSKEILSLAIIYSYSDITNPELSINDDTVYYFKTYNIDLIEGREITDYQLYNRFNTNEDDVKEVLKNTFTKIYHEIIHDQSPLYTEEVCNYSCFLEKRKISANYIDDISLYVEDSKLKVFKFYQKNSEYHDEKYFKDLSYQFDIIEKEGD